LKYTKKYCTHCKKDTYNNSNYYYLNPNKVLKFWNTIEVKETIEVIVVINNNNELSNLYKNIGRELNNSSTENYNYINGYNIEEVFYSPSEEYKSKLKYLTRNLL